MPANLLLLPLLGGFLFVHICYYFRFRAQRLDGYRLLLESALFGLLLPAPARLITYYWPRYFQTGRLVREQWGRLWDAPLSGTATLSLLLGLLVPFMVNWLHATYLHLQAKEPWPFFDERNPRRTVDEFLKPAQREALSHAIENSGNYLHHLLHKAVLQKVPVLITLANRRVYVGYVAESPNLKPEEQHLSLLPVLSGHRASETLTVVFDLVYPDPGTISPKVDFDPKDLLLTAIPFSEVKSVSLYHQDLQKLFLPYKEPVPPDAAESFLPYV